MSDDLCEGGGFEQGPIRPPSEAQSLLVRVTRNCPWNKCTFCPVYKGERFSMRAVADVKRDIDAVHRHIERFRARAEQGGRLSRRDIEAEEESAPGERAAFYAALQWYLAGMRNVFLQDANSLIVRPAHLIEILEHLRMRFPGIRRITSYARSHTVAARKEEDLRALAGAGLNRIHIGMESGADAVLERVRKGVTKAQQIGAGRKVKAAGIELSEYYMPGLGGQALWELHAAESADVLNQVNPDFIRLRTLAIPNRVPLYQEWSAGGFVKCSDRMVVQEIRLFLERLDGISSMIKSDHILNLFGELEGRLPDEKPRMLALLNAFLALPPREQMLFQVGRRAGAFYALSDLEHPRKRADAEELCRELSITPENVDAMIDEIMKRFI